VASEARVAMLRELGADEFVDYRSRLELGASGSFDLVLDLVVNRPARALLGLLKPAGSLVSVLPSAGRIAAAAALPLFSKRRVRFVRVRPSGGDLEVLRSWCESGKLRPVIERVYPLEELRAAHRHSRQGHVAGKLAVAVA
jgi:NADPH:quinone reductase-like Zn-dependent oxidoreductase